MKMRKPDNANTLRAFLSEWDGIRSIVPAASRAQATATVMLSAREAGYKPTWAKIRSVRAPKYDAFASVNCRGCYSEEWAQRSIRPEVK